jgi:hypothetical protein
MNNDWLVALSLERASTIISAINTLSIHAKLTLAGVEDKVDEHELKTARANLLSFLQKLQLLIQRTERGKDHVVLGADPQFGALARQFLTENHATTMRSGQKYISINAFIELIQAEDPDDLATLIPHLKNLREVVERRTQVDSNHVFRDI